MGALLKHWPHRSPHLAERCIQDRPYLNRRNVQSPLNMSSSAMGGIEEAAHLISLRLASLEGQAKVHVYVVQELVSELRSLCDRPGHDQLGQLCRESFGRIGWDWGTNQPKVVPPGMLMSSAEVQSALREITTSAGLDDPM